MRIINPVHKTASPPWWKAFALLVVLAMLTFGLGPVGSLPSAMAEDRPSTGWPSWAMPQAPNQDGVEFKIAYDNGTYRVFMRPESTPSAPNLTLTAQVTVKVPHGTGGDRFTVDSLSSSVTGTAWSQISRADAPVEDPTADYISFGVSFPGGDQSIFNWTGGVEVEVFTFGNTGPCLGEVTLMEDSDPFMPPNSAGTNPGQQISIVGLGGTTDNDYVGNYDLGLADCGPEDTDQDGVPDTLDQDDDGDGIPDVDEGDGAVDTDNNGTPDSKDPDSDGDGVPDATEGHDADHDGVPDVTPGGTDADGDGLDDAYDPDQGGTAAPLPDTDSDNDPDFQDPDDDDDGISTLDEGAGDGDGDGTPDYLDPDPVEPKIDYKIVYDNGTYRVYMQPRSTPSAPNLTLTSQVTVKVPHGAGGNAFSVSNLSSSVGGTAWAVTSRVDAPVEDGSADYLSFGLSFPGGDQTVFNWAAGVEVEVFTFENGGPCLGEVTLMEDSDPFMPPNSAGTNPGQQISVIGLGTSTDNDYGVNYDLGLADCGPEDTDQDGVPDVLDEDDDGDGIPDVDEGDGAVDTDNDGTPDSKDTDSDDDGVPDATEGHDADHDGVPDVTPGGTDADGDGLDDAYDPDQGGTAAPLPDTDSDNTPDFRDTDDDDDGISSLDEGTGDGDGDGTPDYLDPDLENKIDYKIVFDSDEVLASGVRRPDHSGLYRVYMRPRSTPSAPNLTLTSQVTIKVPHGTGADRFTLDNLTSSVPGTAWSQISRVDAPPEDPTSDYISFGVSFPGGDQTVFNWTGGVEVEVFTFGNAGPCLVGEVTLMEDNDPFMPPNSANTNPGQQISVIGLGTPTDNDHGINYDLGSSNCASSTVVTLVSFAAHRQVDGVLLEWETGSEVNSLGFNLHRGGAAIGSWTKLNEGLIVSKVPLGGPLGTMYSWFDASAEPGATYYYLLEHVDACGKATQYGPIWVKGYRLFLPLVLSSR